MKTVSNKVSFPELEQQTLNFWKSRKIFEKSIEQRPLTQEFVFYDGPPFATGLPHYGHLLAGTIKDVIPRYKTMRGYRVERRFGWDCHGLPVEFEMEQTLKLQGRPEIEAFGIAQFNEECRQIVLRYSREWRATVEKMGRWVDFDNDYKTMDLPFMESVWWVFQQLWSKGLIYEGVKVVPYSWRVSTPLSNFEANLNYKEVQDPSITVRFALRRNPKEYFLAWTTTPWTLPANLALCVGPSLKYVKVKEKATGDIYYLGQSRVSTYFEADQIEVLQELSGMELHGFKYEPLFHFAKDKIDTFHAWQMLVDDYVSDDSGTGIVHQAPAFGEDDLRVCLKNQIAVFDPVDSEGNFMPFMEFIAGKNIKEADKLIIRRLKEEGRLFRQETLQHSYPFCWRTDTPLIYKAISTWFVKVEAIKDAMVKNNQKIHWVPEHIQQGRFGKWLENARDWAISRNRFWGTPLPIWKSAEGDILCFGSVKELEEAVGKSIVDIHKHFVDDLVVLRNGKEYRRIPEVLDCWFESGSMPYAQQHYPMENKDVFEKNFPADFICEGLDQTRGWFYTLMVISTALFDQPAFKNVIVNGLVLAEDGKKMSKRLKNYPDPMEMLNKYGADAIRLYMLHSPAVRADDLRFAEKGLIEITRFALLPLWNSLSFLTTYAAIDDWQPVAQKIDDWQPAKESIDRSTIARPKNDLDRWILSVLHKLIAEVTHSLDNYELNKAVTPFVGFIDLLTNWYIRRSRRRFWKAGNGPDKQEAYTTLYYVLVEFAKLIAPFVPFIAENVFQALRSAEQSESVHLEMFPKYLETMRDLVLEQNMELVLSAVTMGRALRNKHQLKIRQPLAKIFLVTQDNSSRNTLKDMMDLIADELNIKEVVIAANEEELVDYSAKANFKALGSRLGPKMKIAAEAIALLSADSIRLLVQGGSHELDLQGSPFTLQASDILIQRKEKTGILVLTDNALTIALDTEITPELREEGFAREFVNKVQNMRKDLDLEVVDRIRIHYQTSATLQQALINFEEFIKTETLAQVLLSQNNKGNFQEWDINGETCLIQIQKL